MKSKKQSKNKASNKAIEIDMMRIDSGAIGFTSGFSQEHKYSTMEPKMIKGRHVECGGAVISKNADAPWPEGSFQEELGLWQ